MWIYIQTYLVFALLTFLMVQLAKQYEKKGRYSFIVLAIFLYSVVMGLRYGLGGDFFTYKEAFKDIVEGRNIDDTKQFEVGFVWMVKIVGSILPSIGLFAIIAFIQLYFFVNGFRKYDCKNLYSYFFISFMMLCVWLNHGNLLRQYISISISVYAITYVVERKFFKYLLFIIIAILFHKSAAIMVLCYPLLRKGELFKNLKYQMAGLMVSLIIMNLGFIQDLFLRVDNLMVLFGYQHYINFKEELIEYDPHIGLGFIITLIINIICILNSNKVKSFFNNKYYNVLYDLFVIGTFLYYVFLKSMLFSRIFSYFSSHLFIIVSFTLYYLIKKKRTQISIILLSLIALTFVATIYRGADNWSLYIFNWQDQYYYLHNDRL